MNPMVLTILAVGSGLVVLLFLTGLAVTVRSRQEFVDERLGHYLEEEVVYTLEGEKTSPVGDWLDNVLAGSRWGDRIARNLARADLKLRPSEYLMVMLILAFGFGFILWYINDRSPLFAIIGAVIGLFLPGFYVRRQQRKRLTRFSDQLADMLNLMVNGLRAGYSTMQAMESVSKELPPPISDEFRRVVQEMQLGIPMEDALDNILRRIPSSDLDLVITAMNVQREVGGNLAEILDTISFTIRERVRIQGEIRVLTTQVMYSGRFLAMMPLIIMGALWLLNRPYMMEFFNPETRIFGLIALGIGLILIATGYFIMTRIGDIEV